MSAVIEMSATSDVTVNEQVRRLAYLLGLGPVIMGC